MHSNDLVGYSPNELEASRISLLYDVGLIETFGFFCLMKSYLMFFREHILFDSIPPALLSSVLDAGNINMKRHGILFLVFLGGMFCPHWFKKLVVWGSKQTQS